MYTIKEASARSGVGIPLLRAWERRYGVVEPTRTPAGYRLYDEDAIARLVAMRRLIDDGWAPQQAAAHVRATEREQLVEIVTPAAGRSDKHTGARPGGADATAAAVELVERIVRAARRLDGAELEAALDETMGSLRFEAAWEAVIMPALHAIGEAWQRGDVSVAGEHATSQAIHRRLARAFDAAGSASTGPAVLIGLPPGARHEFGALAFATAARRSGLPVLYLGPDLPVESWVSASVERQAPAAVVGVPRRADAARASEVVEAVRRERPGAILALGGAEAARVIAAGAVVLPADSLTHGVDALRTALLSRGTPEDLSA